MAHELRLPKSVTLEEASRYLRLKEPSAHLTYSPDLPETLKLERIELRVLFSAEGREKVVGVNRAIELSAEKWAAQGFASLDARVLVELLKQPTLIPHNWASLCDEDGPDLHCQIRFDGTRVSSANNASSGVYTISFSRGTWSALVGPAEPSPQECEELAVGNFDSRGYRILSALYQL